MTNNQTIGSGQLFLLMLIARVIIPLAYGITIGGNTISNGDWLACLLMMLPLIVLGLPTLLLLHRSKNTSVCDYAFGLGKGVGIAVCILYALLFFVLSFTSVGRFSFFVTSTLQTQRGIWFYPILLLLAVWFGAVKGIPALLRAGGILTVICLFAIGLIVVALIPRFEPLNIITPFYNGGQDIGYSLAILVFSSMEPVLLLVLAPRIKGKPWKVYLSYCIVVPLFLCLIFMVILGVLGDFASTQMFPFYGVAGMAGMGELENLSSLEAAVWIIGVFLKSSVYLALSYDCLSFVIPSSYRTVTLLALAVGGVFCSVYISENVMMAQGNFALPVLLGIYLLFVVAIPAGLWIVGLIKRRKRHETMDLFSG